MQHHKSTSALLLTVALTASAGTPVPFGVATFTPLPGPSATSADTPYTMSDDSSIIVGFSTSANLTVPVKWVNDNFALLPLPPGNTQGIARSITADGSIIVGNAGSSFNPRAVKWIDNVPVLIPGPSTNVRSMAAGISADGTFIAGTAEPTNSSRPAWFSLTASGYLPSLQYPLNSFGTGEAISPDGRFIVGTSVRASGAQSACLWTDLGVPIQLPDVPGIPAGSGAYDINREATIVVGTAGIYAVRWVNGGVPELLGSYSNDSFFDNLAGDLTDNGRAIVGIGARSSAIPVAFLWREGRGIAPLKEVLESEFHLDLTGWTLTAASAITPSGSAICGRGTNPQGKVQAWVVRFAPPCLGDLNNTGTIDTADLVYLLGRFGQIPSADEPADLNSDGSVNTADLVRFLGRFGTAC